jgi:hypothetical protein
MEPDNWLNMCSIDLFFGENYRKDERMEATEMRKVGKKGKIKRTTETWKCVV